MNKSIRAALAVLLAAAAGAAQASTWNYAFDFGGAASGVSGSFQGTAVDGMIRDISDVSLNIAGTPYTFAHSDDVTGDFGDSPYIAVDGSSYDFHVYGSYGDIGLQVGGSAHNAMVDTPDGRQDEFFTFMVGFDSTGFVFGREYMTIIGQPPWLDLPPLSIWAAAPTAVPEPADVALLAAGLACVGAAARRRRAKG